MKRVLSVLASVLLVGLLHGGFGLAQPGGDDAKIEMEPIKLKELLKQVADQNQKGKIVVIDLWGFFCAPCKEEFPNLVRLHHTYGSKGVVCMSLSMDFNDELRKKAIGFLRDKKAVFKNYWLEDGMAKAGEYWKFEPLPVVVVYGKDGNIAKVFNNNDPDKESYKYSEVEDLVKKLIAK